MFITSRHSLENARVTMKKMLSSKKSNSDYICIFLRPSKDKSDVLVPSSPNAFRGCFSFPLPPLPLPARLHPRR